MERRSESIAKLMKALAAAQAEIPLIPRESENPFHKSRYAGLGNTLKVVGPILAKHGIAVIQPISCEGGKVIVTTMLALEDEWIAGDLALQAVNLTPQSIASASTYARRYGYQGMTGVAAEDDDAENAEGRPKGATKESMKAAQKEIADTKIRELKKRSAEKSLGVGPGDLKRAEVPTELEKQLEASVRNAQEKKKTEFEQMLESFAFLKKQCADLGEPELYYAVLDGAGNYRHANQFGSFEEARRVYKLLANEVSALKGRVGAQEEEAAAMREQ